MACPIFCVTNSAWRLEKDLDRLETELISRLRQSDKALFKNADAYKHEETEEHDHPIGWVLRGSTFTIPVTLRGKGPTRGRTLSVRFDLHRDKTEEATWPHAEESLLVVGFYPEKGERWENNELIVTGDGRLSDADAWAECGGNSHANRQLLEWGENKKSVPWSQRGWVFAVPMQTLTDTDALDREVIHPIVALLKGSTPSDALKGTSAVRWAEG